MSGAPGDASFYPPVTTSTRIPRRAFGFGGGAHVYFFRLGVSRLGFGVDAMRTRGTATTVESVTPTSQTDAAAAVARTVKAKMMVTTLAPQVSFNFGSHDGWSYLSGGYGTTTTRGAVNIPTSGTDGGSGSRGRQGGAINVGGGARWFLRERLAFGFDVRFNRLRAARGLPSKQIVCVSVGISFR